MSKTDTRVADTKPRGPALERSVAMRLAATEYERNLELLRQLSADDWSRPTACSAWDVRAMAGHNTGMALMASGLRQMLRQDKAARKRSGEVHIDNLTALQVEEHADLTTAELIDRFAEIGPRAARGRRRMPGLLRRMTMGEEIVNDAPEKWTNGFLIDTILTRDPWMHRMDISRATGRPPHLTPEHDGVLVADVVAEWFGRHGQPCRLVLEGLAGGTFEQGSGGPEIRMDAIDFCRVLSGRAADTPVQHDLLGTQVPF